VERGDDERVDGHQNERRRRRGGLRVLSRVGARAKRSGSALARGRCGAVFGAGAVSLLCCGCGGGATTTRRSALERYLAEVEPIRLSVNRLLEGADPVLGGLTAGRISRAGAARRIGTLERRFSEYAVRIAAVRPRDAELRALNEPYAETYVLEDSYLSALAVGIAEDKLDDLPNTQNEQRAAIIRWRTRLTVLAGELHAQLPPDLQQAGRGEIAPSPGGS
jgi:hypothetical protein